MLKVSEIQNSKWRPNRSFTSWTKAFLSRWKPFFPKLKAFRSQLESFSSHWEPFRSSRKTFAPQTNMFVTKPLSIRSPLHFFSRTLQGLWQFEDACVIFIKFNSWFVIYPMYYQIIGSYTGLFFNPWFCRFQTSG